jgi:hypothetical protein
VRRTPHLQPFPGSTPLPDPGWQVATRRAGHRDVISPVDRGLNQIPDAHGHAIDGSLGNNENARGLPPRGGGGRISVTAGFQPASKIAAPRPRFTLRRSRTQCLFRMPLSGSVSVRIRMIRSSQSDQCSM